VADPARTGPAPAEFPDPRAVLRAYGLRPRKGLGQHFLVDRAALARIVGAAALSASDTVLEVGPGPGLLTAALAERAGRVVAVELDSDLATVLRGLFALRPNVEIVAADILRVDPATLVGVAGSVTGRVAGYQVVANLPYHITSAVLRHLLEARARPERLVVMVQKEVAERILAQPGQLSVLAVSVQLYAAPSLVTLVPASAFYPAPKVDSAVLRLDVHPEPPADVTDLDAFFEVVRAGFGQKRKQLKNSLAAGLGLDAPTTAALLSAAHVDGTRRAETLALPEWAALAQAWLARGPCRASAGQVQPGHHVQA
jgi:16S rRNA (adenine1518-N6/adenine1519-N6)-dimethyltransferase